VIDYQVQVQQSMQYEIKGTQVLTKLRYQSTGIPPSLNVRDSHLRIYHNLLFP